MTIEQRKFVRLNYHNTSLSDMSRQIRVHVATIQYYCKQMGFKPYKKVDRLKEYMKDNPTATNSQIGVALGRSYMAVTKAKCILKKHSR